MRRVDGWWMTGEPRAAAHLAARPPAASLSVRHQSTRARQTHLNILNTLPGRDFGLITLGRVALLSPDGGEHPLGKRRRTLALLAVLALARRPVPRDTLIEMFWGDQEETRARHSLANALSSIRQALGTETVTTRSAEVALVPGGLVVDAVELV